MMIVPLGINCTTCISLDLAKMKGVSFPFDYIDTSSYAYIRKVLVLEKDNVREFVGEYFSPKNFDRNTCKSVDTTWFPHMVPGQNHIWGGDEILNTYTRRIERLLDTIDNEETVIFISGSFVYDESRKDFNKKHYIDITNYLKYKRQNKKNYFISYNLFDDNFMIDSNHVNFNLNITNNGDKTPDYNSMGKKLKTIIVAFSINYNVDT